MKKRIIKILGMFFISTSILLSSTVTSFAAYEVQKGDTLSRIAARHSTTVEALMQLNSDKLTNPDHIIAGSLLRVDANDTVDIVNELRKTNDQQAALKTILVLAAGQLAKETDEKRISALKKLCFDADYYTANADVVALLGDAPNALLNHFLSFGFWEGRQPNADFNLNVYYSAYPDLQKAYANMSPRERALNLFLHYYTFGQYENRTITTLDQAAKAGVLVISAIDGQTVIQEIPVANDPAPEPAPEPAPAPVPLSVNSIFEDYYLAVRNANVAGLEAILSSISAETFNTDSFINSIADETLRNAYKALLNEKFPLSKVKQTPDWESFKDILNTNPGALSSGIHEFVTAQINNGTVSFYNDSSKEIYEKAINDWYTQALAIASTASPTTYRLCSSEAGDSYKLVPAEHTGSPVSIDFSLCGIVEVDGIAFASNDASNTMQISFVDVTPSETMGGGDYSRPSGTTFYACNVFKDGFIFNATARQGKIVLVETEDGEYRIKIHSHSTSDGTALEPGNYIITVYKVTVLGSFSSNVENIGSVTLVVE